MMIRRLVGEISLLPPEWSITVTRATQSLLDWKREERSFHLMGLYLDKEEGTHYVVISQFSFGIDFSFPTSDTIVH